MLPIRMSFFRGGEVRHLFSLLLFAVFLLPTAQAVSFRNDVMAVISKAGCNAGACHGNANGKAGFKLSLRGEDPALDYLALTRDQFGRRANPFEPDQSLLLLKPTAQIAHEGGKRFEKGSVEYNIFRAWIAQGAQADPAGSPKLTSLRVEPSEKIVVEPAATCGIQVTAEFSDGTRRDVSGLAVYEPATAGIVEVSHNGQVTRQRFGEVTILVRFLDRQLTVRLAFLPARPGFVWNEPPAANFVDREIFAKLRAFRINPSELCSDSEFIRRAYLDLLGILPPVDVARQFVEDPHPDKRARLVDDLLERGEFADFWALKWSDLLRNEERVLDRKGVELFNDWIREGFASHKPLDQFARELISARGSTYRNPAANFYRANRTPIERGLSTAQVFLGTRLQCAQCHNHPYDRWTQQDYYDWAGFFSRVQYKILENRRGDNNDQHEFKGEQVVYLARAGEVKNPRTGRPAQPHFLGGGQPEAGSDPLVDLANWVASPQNPWFARVQANRIWFHLMGRGLVDPIDDFRATNPASHPQLLDALARELVEHAFDLRHVIRLIMASRAYQLSSMPNESNLDDETNYSHTIVRRLSAEQLLDAQSASLGASVRFAGFPTGLRAAQLPGGLAERRRGQKTSASESFLAAFGKPPRLLACDCERSNEPTMTQAFQMIGGAVLNDLLTDPANRLSVLLKSGHGNAEIVEELYWAALTRAPSVTEGQVAMSRLDKAADRRAELEDIAWALLNSKEFLLRK